MKPSKTSYLFAATVACCVFLDVSHATERATAELALQSTKITTVTAPSASSPVLGISGCPRRVEVFAPGSFTCPAAASICTLELTATSEVSDVTPGGDTIQFRLEVDGVSTGVLPTANFDVHSTAKANQIESATATWMHRNIQPGNHTHTLQACVQNRTAGDGASAFAGDRILTLRVYNGN
jgi:hypothetical protein